MELFFCHLVETFVWSSCLSRVTLSLDIFATHVGTRSPPPSTHPISKVTPQSKAQAQKCKHPGNENYRLFVRTPAQGEDSPMHPQSATVWLVNLKQHHSTQALRTVGIAFKCVQKRRRLFSLHKAPRVIRPVTLLFLRFWDNLIAWSQRNGAVSWKS